MPDTIAWAANLNGMFTVNSFCKELGNMTLSTVTVPNLIWSGWCPPKVELFLWQLWKGKVLVKEVLRRFDMAHMGDWDFLLCSK